MRRAVPRETHKHHISFHENARLFPLMADLCPPLVLIRVLATIAGSDCMHALIIEDEFLVALSIEDSLEALGFTSRETVATEETAVASACLNTPDLITADVRLAKGSGISAVRTILREHPIPVVFITGNVETVREEMPQAVVLQKPYQETALRDAITVARRSITACGALEGGSTGGQR